MRKNEEVVINDHPKKYDTRQLKSTQSLRMTSFCNRSGFSARILNKISKFGSCFVDTKARRYYYVTFYIFICLLGNIVTGLFLYYHYFRSAKLERKVNDINRNINDDTHNLSNLTIEDNTSTKEEWITAVENDVEKIFNSLSKDKSTKVCQISTYHYMFHQI